MKKILIAPAYNEEGKIGQVVKRSKPFVNEVLVVNDFSKDKTPEEAKKAGATVINHEINKGVGAAIRTGISYALKNNYDLIFVIGGDNQDNPEEIPRFIKKIEEGYDFVQGSRYLEGGRTVNMPTFRKITTKLHSSMFTLAVKKFKVTDGTNGFRAYKKEIFRNKNINMFQDWLDRYELEVYLFYKIVRLGYKVTEVPVTKSWFKEQSYTKMVPIVDWWRMLKPLIWLRFRIK